MRTLVVLSLTLTVLAGCSDGDDEPAEGPTSTECLERGLILNQTAARCEEPPFAVRDFEDPDHFCVQNERRDRVHAPDLVGDPWVLGQSWTYDLSVDGDALEPTQLVYYDDQDLDGNDVAAHYMVGTPTREEALRHAVFSENPMIGRIHRVLYSPHESGDHADMFHFPLCDGSTWTTRFFAEEFTLTARDATLSVPGLGQDEGFRIEGSAPSGSTLALTYSPAAQWFTQVDLERTDGSSVRMSLIETDEGYSGNAFFLRGQQDTSFALGPEASLPVGAVLLAEHAFEREDGRDGAYDTLGIAVRAALNGTGQATLELTGPDGEPAWSHELAGGDAVDLLFEVPYQAGTWTATMQGAGLGADGGGFAAFDVVSIYDRSGSV